MATVRLTQQLKDDIISKAQNTFNQANPDPSNAQLRRLVADAIPRCPIYVDIVEATNKWVEKYPDTMACFLSADINQKRETTIISTLDLKLDIDGTPKAIGLNIEDYSVSIIKSHLIPQRYSFNAGALHVDALADNDRAAIISEATTYWKNCRAKAEANTTYVEQIRNALNACTTLKQLLELWPQAENIVPAGAMAQLRQKAVRNKVDAESVALDTSLLNSTLVRAKLNG